MEMTAGWPDTYDEGYIQATLEITTTYCTLANGDAVLPDRTFVPSAQSPTANYRKKKSLKFLAFQIFERFKCETIP